MKLQYKTAEHYMVLNCYLIMPRDCSLICRHKQLIKNAYQMGLFLEFRIYNRFF